MIELAVCSHNVPLKIGCDKCALEKKFKKLEDDILNMNIKLEFMRKDINRIIDIVASEGEDLCQYQEITASQS